MNFQNHKQSLRRKTRQSRVDLTNREERSTQIQQSALSLPELHNAQHVLVYVGYRSEVSTRFLIQELLHVGKSIYVPWCENDELRLFRMESLEELQPGAFNIPEPPVDLRTRKDRQGKATSLDAIFLPGLAFDFNGNRLGQGKGYYDRLLAEVSENCTLIGLAFAVQVVEEVPTEPHDVPLDVIVTDEKVIRCS